ncbi:MAG: YraN family protein [Solirubrobacterales bacterium]
MTFARQRLGSSAEDLAARRLAQAGWRIVARNERTRYGEIDLIGLDCRALVFVEVKAGRPNPIAGPERPALAVGGQKQRRIRQLAAAYLAGRPPLPRFDRVRFDVIGVVIGHGGEVAGYEHIADAF